MDNIYQQLKEYTPEILAQLLEPAKEKVYNRPSYVCPLCGHGKGGDGLAIMPDQNGRVNYIKCFGCKFYGDIVDLYQQVKGIERGQAIEQLTSLIGIATPAPTPTQKASGPIEFNEVLTADPEPSPDSADTADSADSEASGLAVQPKEKTAEYLTECAEQLPNSEGEAYLSVRGINTATAQRFGLGYDPTTKALTIPTAGDSYIMRATSEEVKWRYKNKGEAHLFNEGELNVNNSISLWIVEGALDALTLEQIGQPAIGLNSTENVNKFLEILKQCKTVRPLILALDNDQAGERATAKLTQELKGQPFKFIVFNEWPNNIKDCNEWLINNPASLAEIAPQWQEKASTNTEADLYYLKHNLLSDIEKQAPPTPCNLENVNELLGGGFRAGLYILGAISSLGKTTLAQQIAVDLAKAGQPVLFFSLEQNRLTLTAKNLNRVAHQQGRTDLTARKILEAYPDHAEEINKAVDILASDIGDRLITVTDLTDWPSIKEYISKYSKRYKVKPVIFVDYLQRLKTPNKNRQLELKDIVAEMQRTAIKAGVTFLTISSLNRANYSTPIDFEAFKEAGEIEYTADVVLGLQLTVLSEQDMFLSDGQIIKRRERIKNELKKCPRRVELVALKNRFNGLAEPAKLIYNSAGDLFTVDSSTADFWENDSDGEAIQSSGFYKRVDLVNHKPQPHGNE